MYKWNNAGGSVLTRLVPLLDKYCDRNSVDSIRGLSGRRINDVITHLTGHLLHYLPSTH